jgi:hypothetical protein
MKDQVIVMDELAEMFKTRKLKTRELEEAEVELYHAQKKVSKLYQEREDLTLAMDHLYVARASHDKEKS